MRCRRKALLFPIFKVPYNDKDAQYNDENSAINISNQNQIKLLFLTNGDVNQPIDVYSLVTNTHVDNTTIFRCVGNSKLDNPSVIADINFYEDQLYGKDWSTLIGRSNKKKECRKIKPVLAFSCSKMYKVISDVYHYIASKNILFLSIFLQYRLSFCTDLISNRELKIIVDYYQKNASNTFTTDVCTYEGPIYKMTHFFTVMTELFDYCSRKNISFYAYVNEIRCFKNKLFAWSDTLIQAMSRQAFELQNLHQSVGITANNFFYKHLIRASPIQLPFQSILDDHKFEINEYMHKRQTLIKDYVRGKTLVDLNVDISLLKSYQFLQEDDKNVAARRGFGFNKPLNIHELKDYTQTSGMMFYQKETFFLYRANGFNAIKLLVQLGAAIPVYDCATGLQRTDVIDQQVWTRKPHNDGFFPGTPLLLVSTDPSKRLYRYQSLTSPSIFLNKVFLQDKELQKRLAKHVRNPNWSNHKNCAKLITKLSYKNKLCFHEYINPSLPVYTVSIDIDSKTDRFASWLDSENRWEKRVQLVSAFERTILTLYREYLAIENSAIDKNISVFVYESFTQGNLVTNKRGFRVIVKCRHVVFCSSMVVNSLLKILQILFNIDPILKLTGKTSIDSIMYVNGYKSIRLPLCCKSMESGEGCLVPLLVDPGKIKGQLTFTTFFIHHKPSNYSDKLISVVKQVPTVSTRMIRELTSSETIHRDIYTSKFKKPSMVKTCNKETAIQCFERYKQDLVNIRHLRTFKQIPNIDKTQLAHSSIKRIGKSQYYKWADKIYFCPHKCHTVILDHPVSYTVRIRHKREPFLIQVYAWCWGSECVIARNRSVKDVKISADIA